MQKRKPKKGKHITFAVTVPLNDRDKFLLKKLYSIEFTPAFEILDEDDQAVIIHHELLHIPRDKKGTVKHDYEEFEAIVKKYGSERLLSIVKKADEREGLKSEKAKLAKQQEKINKKIKKDEVM